DRPKPLSKERLYVSCGLALRQRGSSCLKALDEATCPPPLRHLGPPHYRQPSPLRMVHSAES
ncbi:unnamed protein product, partial [Musa hybrid cultivar]